MIYPQNLNKMLNICHLINIFSLSNLTNNYDNFWYWIYIYDLPLPMRHYFGMPFSASVAIKALCNCFKSGEQCDLFQKECIDLDSN